MKLIKHNSINQVLSRCLAAVYSTCLWDIFIILDCHVIWNMQDISLLIDFWVSCFFLVSRNCIFYIWWTLQSFIDMHGNYICSCDYIYNIFYLNLLDLYIFVEVITVFFLWFYKLKNCPQYFQTFNEAILKSKIIHEKMIKIQVE